MTDAPGPRIGFLGLGMMVLKDFGLISRLAESCGVPMPATAAAQQVSRIEAVRAGARDEDFSAVIRTIQRLAGLSE